MLKVRNYLNLVLNLIELHVLMNKFSLKSMMKNHVILQLKLQVNIHNYVYQRKRLNLIQFQMVVKHLRKYLLITILKLIVNLR